MFNIDAPQARQIITVSETIGAKLPKPVTAAFERTARIREAAGKLGAREGALVTAIIAALDAGTDLATDPEVQRIVAAQTLGNGIQQAVENQVADDMRIVFRDQAEHIIAAWRPVFDAAAAELLTCRAALGDVALEDTASILRAGGQAADTWARATKANDRLEQINGAWQSLGMLTRLAPNDQRYHVLRVADVDPETWETQQLERQKLSAWELARRGLNLSLASVADYRARIRAIEHAAEVAQEQAEQRRRDAMTGRRTGLKV